MTRALPHWLRLILATFSVVLVIVVVLIVGCLRVDYRMERGSHHGLQRTTETGTAWLNPFLSSEQPFLILIAVSASDSLPTRIEQDHPEVFRTSLETSIMSLTTDSWLPLGFGYQTCGNVFVETYESNDRFREAVRKAIADGRLNRYDLLPLTQYCSDAIPPGKTANDPPGKDLLVTLLHESLPRPALPHSSPASSGR
jgi:hypothetical protein